MIRGGDTPTQETLFAIEFESGKFAYGHADEDELFVATRDGLAQIWYADANGVVTGHTPNADNVASAIIDAYNEHFGTDIQIWTPETKNLQVGDTVPNWNAYEKILLPEMVNFRYLRTGSSANITGFMQGDKAYLNAANENSIWTVSPEGEVWNGGGPASIYEEQTKTLLLSNYGRQISEVLPLVVEWQQGSQVPNWESYTLLS